MTKYEKIMLRVKEHYEDAKKKIPEDRIIGIFLEGSQNYRMDLPDSDVDTKVFIFPSIDDIIYNKEPLSTTWIRENNEHISVKDIRLVFNTFRKQNLNFVEVLFTMYYILNPKYDYFWKKLVYNRDDIARYNEFAAIMAMCGVAQNKYKMIFKPSEATEKGIEQFGYAPKQLHHLKRIEYFLETYMSEESYISCMRPPLEVARELVGIKVGKYNDIEAKVIADEALNHINNIRQNVINHANIYSNINLDAEKILNQVQKDLMLEYLRKEV